MLSILKRKSKKGDFHAYVIGIACPITEVPDEIFSKKLMGDGIAIIAKGSMLYAPCAGKITLIAPTKHAIAIQTRDNVQLLLHIGLDSALHDKDSFKVLVSLDDDVTVNEPLIELSDACLLSEEQLYIPMVIVENPSNKVFHFIDDINIDVGIESVIGTYE